MNRDDLVWSLGVIHDSMRTLIKEMETVAGLLRVLTRDVQGEESTGGDDD